MDVGKLRGSMQVCWNEVAVTKWTAWVASLPTSLTAADTDLTTVTR